MWFVFLRKSFVMSDNKNKKALDSKRIDRNDKKEMGVVKKNFPDLTLRQIENSIDKVGTSREKVYADLQKTKSYKNK